jgi:hypothetical protein
VGFHSVAEIAKIMRLTALIVTLLPLAACSTAGDSSRPYAEANSLMLREIQARIGNIPFQHRQELLNNLLWLASRGGEPAIPALVSALEHDEPKVRSSAAWVLGRMHDRRVIPDLRPLVKDDNHSVRFEAARSLTLMGDMQYASLLIEGLDSDLKPVRYNCHMALKDATGRDFQYDHLAELPGQRRAAVLRWREWWAEQLADPHFATSYAAKYGLNSDVGQPAPAPQPARPMVETKPTEGPTSSEKPWVTPNLSSEPARPAKPVVLPPGKGSVATPEQQQAPRWIDRILENVDSESVAKPAAKKPSETTGKRTEKKL